MHCVVRGVDKYLGNTDGLTLVVPFNYPYVLSFFLPLSQVFQDFVFLELFFLKFFNLFI